MRKNHHHVVAMASAVALLSGALGAGALGRDISQQPNIKRPPLQSTRVPTNGAREVARRLRQMERQRAKAAK